jgi:ribosomal protein L11 methyltransferase
MAAGSALQRYFWVLRMPWISLAVETDDAHAQVFGDALIELGALSTDLHDAAVGTEREQPLFDEAGEAPGRVWLASEVTALFNEAADIPSILQAAADAAGLPFPISYRITRVEEQDWVRITQAQFIPIQISPRLWVVPSWHQIPDRSAVNLILDPGLAFGTGSHPSTQLCLAWLDENLRGGEDVLDYGCGSGILSIAAAKLGAGRVIGVDIDPLAVDASRQNAVLNQCSGTQLRFHEADAAAYPREIDGISVDIIVANILARPLIMLEPILTHAMRTAGCIALSGILSEQAEEVMRAYGHAFDMRIAREKDSWVLLTGTRT